MPARNRASVRRRSFAITSWRHKRRSRPTCRTPSVDSPRGAPALGFPGVLLLDVYSLFYRAFFALPEMNTRAGEPTSALYGFSTLLLKLLREERPAAAM